MQGWRDFLLHLITITIGLLIALSLEGLVEWQHHRHLVHEAEASLHAEIKSNADGIAASLNELHKQQAILNKDVSILKTVIATAKLPPDHHMSITFNIIGFDGVAWKTAQSTGALSYMSYDLAQEYGSIYTQQDLLTASENQAARDAVVSLGPLMDDDSGNDTPPTRDEAREVVTKIEVLQGQLLLVDSLMKGLNDGYKAFLTEHPN
jgi:hypothetical protein